MERIGGVDDVVEDDGGVGRVSEVEAIPFSKLSGGDEACAAIGPNEIGWEQVLGEASLRQGGV